jgi:fatty-acyl-CoA synthase
MKMVVSSGMMWSPEVKLGLLEFMPDAVMSDGLGASESAGIAYSVVTRDAPPSEARFNLANAIVLRPDDLTPVEPGSGEIGIIAKSGDIPLGYYKDPERTARTYVSINGVRHILGGDHALVEADGSIRLLGRGSHCINTAGEKVYPEEVEEALKTHPSVEDALVVGLPDEKWGQSVTGVVRLAEGASLDEDSLRAHVRRSLAGYKTPKRVVATDQSIRASNGKADYATAKKIAETTLA